MKYLIRENQEEAIKNSIKNLVSNHLAESTWVCDLEVNSIDDSDYKFEILIILNEYVLSSVSAEIREVVSEMIPLNVRKYLLKWMPHLEKKIRIKTTAQYC